VKRKAVRREGHFLFACALIAGSSVFAGCQTTRPTNEAASIPRSAASRAPRFTAVHEIQLKIDSSVKQLPMTDGLPMTPQFPFSERLNGGEAFPVVAYVIGTNGRIEPGTLTFLVSLRTSFAYSLCTWADRAWFTPARDSTGVRRALAVQSFGFQIVGKKEREVPDAKPYWQRLQDLGPDSAFTYLERFAHCGMLK